MENQSDSIIFVPSKFESNQTTFSKIKFLFFCIRPYFKKHNNKNVRSYRGRLVWGWFWLWGCDISQILYDFFSIFCFSGTRFTRTQDTLVFPICKIKINNIRLIVNIYHLYFMHLYFYVVKFCAMKLQSYFITSAK